MSEVTDTSTMSTDTSTMETAIPCDPDKIYFNTQILPILKTNCAISGCHDSESAQDDVILETYESVMATADVEAFNLEESKLYKVLVEDDERKRMPLAPATRLNPDVIQLIATWILQGAENIECSTNACVTDEVSFSLIVHPIIKSLCESCHSGNSPSGGVSLANYEAIKAVGESGKLIGAISWADGFKKMPQGGDKLAQCTIDQMSAWIEAGAPNN